MSLALITYGLPALTGCLLLLCIGVGVRGAWRRPPPVAGASAGPGPAPLATPAAPASPAATAATATSAPPADGPAPPAPPAGSAGPAARDVPDTPAARADDVPRGAHEVAVGALGDDAAALLDALRIEETARARAEEQLRVVRRALARLETESREREGERAELLIVLEEELESRMRESAAEHERATRETTRRLETERRVAELETTLGRVVRALERERSRGRDEIAALARQHAFQEAQRRARHERERLARSVEGKLTRRLARKVARGARPLAQGG